MRGTVSSCAVIWWNEETKSNRGNTRPFPRGSRTWSTRGKGSWLRLLIWLSFLQFTVIPTPPNFFGMATRGLEYGEVECWIKSAARYWSKVASTHLGKVGSVRCGLDVAGALPLGVEITKGIEEQEPNFRLVLRENARKTSDNTPQLSDGLRGPVRAMKVKTNRSQMKPQTCQDAQERRALF